MLKEFFVRDPDPLWRWASGQYVHRMRSHPLVKAALPTLLWLGISACVWLYKLLLSRSDAIDAIDAFGSVTLCYTAVAWALLFFASVLRPFDALNAKGGPTLARELHMASLSPYSLPHLYFWGLYREFAVYYLVAYFPAGFLLALLLLADGAGMKTVIYLALFFGLKAPLDYFANLALGWDSYFRTGSKPVGRIYNVFYCMVLFPGISAGAFIFLLSLTRGSIIGPVLATPTPPVFATFVNRHATQILLGIFSLIYTTKVWLAYRCYRTFIRKFDERLADKFLESG